MALRSGFLQLPSPSLSSLDSSQSILVKQAREGLGRATSKYCADRARSC
jgi:hypothetical protein